jgi:hypothetical protein
VDTAVDRDFIAEFDAAIGCHQCEGPLGDSPSDDFCGEGCQERWHAAHAEATTIQVRWGTPRVRPHPLDTAVATALGYDAYRRRYALGVTPDGEVISRRLDGQLAAVDHVVHVAGYAGPPSLAAFVEQTARDRAHLTHEAALPAGWIEQFAGVALADWQVEILRGQYQRWEAVGRHYRAELTRVMAAFAPIVGQMGRAAADATAALQPFVEVLAPRKSPADPRQRALWLRRNRNTGPSTSSRAPRTINPRRGR